VIRIFDTASRRKVDLSPCQPGRLGMYVCGVTAYDLCHVGHARSAVAFDVVRRHLRSSGLVVTFVRNVTDVDDKIIRRAAETAEDPLALSRRYTEELHRDMAALGVLPPDIEPRVSDHMPEILALVARLLEREVAYVVDGDVYFSVDSFPAYGGLSGQSLDEMRAGARVEVDERKRNPLDFALWKAAKPGEPRWPSPWGEGRPGWHIECSAMSQRYLGETFDIHGGGKDLVFPHHENERAQSQAANGPSSFARIWMHNGFVNLNQEKMAKSTGNFFTIRQVLDRHHGEALRYFLISTHYRSPLSFDLCERDGQLAFPNLEEAERRLAYCYQTLSRLDEALAAGKQPGVGEKVPDVERLGQELGQALDDDFNTAAALAALAEQLTLANKLLDEPGGVAKDVRRRSLFALREQLRAAGEVLGLFERPADEFLRDRRLRLAAARGLRPAEIEAAIARRDQARRGRQFAEADAIRAELRQVGVELMDGARGTNWRVAE
jgi:cysteinyl-tRNA synthetase